MFSPLLQSVIDREGYRVVADDELDTVATALPFSMLFVAGDAARIAESDDVAVVVPELEKALAGAVTVLVADRASERDIQRRFRFNAFPALIFLRYGEYLGVIQRIQDWNDYLRDIPQILASEPSDPPPFKFPDGCGAPQPSQQH
ncbi:hydrogenase-1 expression HyaE [Oricola thermophila]|uniref:Hydrogenase-1 expression HyaE n=1 Tax=Oricola thermophila TaxID=2742145 RepID=A0A6N1V8Q1_9HYPH|nr:hydrogenase-1 expression HyaE [Oricola thermophila]QKV17314.1 hydrogenase-1 expression HyaE [Oricola thermophila]